MQCEPVNRVPKKVVYFSRDENNEVLNAHLESGGTAYFARKQALIEATGDVQRVVADVSMSAVVMNGTADFQIAKLTRDDCCVPRFRR
jgi:hypothetical protein